MNSFYEPAAEFSVYQSYFEETLGNKLQKYHNTETSNICND